jgi:hydrogenase maturation protease
VGNIFLGDDGFGVEVVNRLEGQPLPAGVRVADYGIRALHLAYELLNGYYALILVDAVAQGGPPGTVSVFEPDLAAADIAPADGHAVTPDTVFALLRALGGELDGVYVVGCEPLEMSERMGLSPVVAGAVGIAVSAVRTLAFELAGVISPDPGPLPGQAESSHVPSTPVSIQREVT